LRSSIGKNGLPIRVVVATSTQMECQLLVQFLQGASPKIKIVGYSPNPVEVESILKQQKPDMAIVSPNLGDGPFKGLDLVRKIRDLYPSIRSIVLLDAAEPQMVTYSFQAGAKGVYSRERSMEALPKCIQVVHNGQIWVSTQELQILLEALNRRSSSKPFSVVGTKSLTKREADIAHLAAEGFRNYEIAQQLTLSTHTVKNYLYRIFEKLGLSSRVELANRVMSMEAADPLPVRAPTQSRIAS
jgi:two-component system nitrate/nitrite response regulator NarL